MKGRVIALDEIEGRKAAALIVDGRLDDLLIDPAEQDAPIPGAVYRAICDRPLKGQGGMILRLPDGATGFLREGRGLRPGQSLLVQVSTHAEEGKAAPVTTRLLFKSRYAIITPGAPGINISRAIKDEEARVRLLEIAHEIMEGDSAGLILRSASADADDQDIAADIAQMRDLAHAVLGDAEGREPELLLDGPDAHLLAWRDWEAPDLLADAPGAFRDHDVGAMIDALASPRVDLAGGAFAFIEPTRALVAVDVNTGADTSPAAGLKANIALARDLPRQLRLRGLGGQIAVDFAPMPKKDRRQLEQVLRAVFRADRVETALAGWTQLGLFELQRKRERLPLALPR
jgi:ribonuclease G